MVTGRSRPFSSQKAAVKEMTQLQALGYQVELEQEGGGDVTEAGGSHD